MTSTSRRNMSAVDSAPPEAVTSQLGLSVAEIQSVPADETEIVAGS